MRPAPHRRHLARAATALISALALAAPTTTVAHATDAGPHGFDIDVTNTTPLFEKQTLATGGEGGFNCYRIPSLGVSKQGTLLASYDGRPYNCADAPQPNSIVLRTSTDNGANFTPQRAIAEGFKGGSRGEGKYGYSDPSIIVDWDTGQLFNFHVKSFDVSFQHARPGLDPTQRDAIHSAYATSTDGGATWEADNIITADVTPDKSIAGRFATSGNGIQIAHGRFAGRLIQPAAVKMDGTYKAVMWMSDNGGKTWYSGKPFGTGMDENKVVELADGRLMNSSRASDGTRARKISYSNDGGMTFSQPVPDKQLPDPHNNASIIRAFPNAAQDDPKAHVLLFSNTASTSARTNPTVRLSCDDGRTWPVAKALPDKLVQYTSMATLPDGTVGILYEGHNSGANNDIHFAKFNTAWLGGLCATITGDEITATPGETVDATVVVENTVGGDIVDRPITFDAPEGWTITADNVTIPAGQRVEVPIHITAPVGGHASSIRVPAHIEDTTPRHASVDINVLGGREPGPADITITSRIRDEKPAYNVGDKIFYDFIVNNPSTKEVGVFPVEGNLENFLPEPGQKSCRWGKFPAKSTQTCGFASYTVKAEDVERGYVEVNTVWNIGKAGFVTNADFKKITLPTPKTVASDDPEAGTPRYAALSIDPISPQVIPADDGGEEATHPVHVTIHATDEEGPLPEDAKIILYRNGERLGEYDLADGTAQADITVPAATGHHDLIARLLLPTGSGARPIITSDATASFDVTLEEHEATITLGDVAPYPASDSPRSIPVSAKLTRNGEPISGQTITFTAGEQPIGTAVTGEDGLATIAYEAPAGEHTTVIHATAALDDENPSADTTIQALPPEPIPTTTVTATTTVTETPKPEVITTTTTVEPEPIVTTTTVTKTAPAPAPITVTADPVTVTEKAKPVTETTTVTKPAVTITKEPKPAPTVTKTVEVEKEVPTTVKETVVKTEVKEVPTTVKETVVKEVPTTVEKPVVKTETVRVPAPAPAPVTKTEWKTSTVTAPRETTTATTTVTKTQKVTVKAKPTTVTATTTLTPKPVTTTVTKPAVTVTLTEKPAPVTKTVTKIPPAVTVTKNVEVPGKPVVTTVTKNVEVPGKPVVTTVTQTLKVNQPAETLTTTVRVPVEEGSATSSGSSTASSQGSSGWILGVLAVIAAIIGALARSAPAIVPLPDLVAILQQR